MEKLEDGKLNVIVLPYFIYSHITPLVQIGRKLAAACSGVAVTILTTPSNAALFQASIDQDASSGQQISTHALKFPSSEAGLPEGIESFSTVTSPDMHAKLYYGISLLRKEQEQFIRDRSPHFIVTDMFFSWTVDLAEELQIPRIVFDPSCVFYRCVVHSFKLNSLDENNVESDSESFLIPGLPDEVKFKSSHIPDYYKKNDPWFGKVMDEIAASERRSYGIVLNSFYELEPTNIDYLQKVIGMKAWNVGPLSLSFSSNTISTEKNSINKSWLDAQKPGTVVYACFGSMVRFGDAQLTETALALQASNHSFIWVVRNEDRDEDSWLPVGFEERMVESKKGLILRGWVPQQMILNHPAIGGFLTHCGWNSVLEGVTSGVPLITWQLFSEQFMIEKLVIEVLKIGVGVGAEVWNRSFDITSSPIIGRDKIERAVRIMMDDGNMETEKRRKRVKELQVKADAAVKEGGSSYNDITALIQEMKACANSAKIAK